MRFRVLALDYDGTIAVGGRLNAAVRDAADYVRSCGISILLVTGPILADLQGVAGDLTWCDAIVSENGATMSFPASGRKVILARAVSPTFIRELTNRGIHARAGECIVEADASEAERILAVIREMELPLVLLFNRGRLMVLPQAVSKATGLQAALRSLRLSEHNALAIGDAENDHELLEFCEHGVAVAWGSRTLKAAADAVLEGIEPSSVAHYIREAATHMELPTKTAVRRHLLLGTREDGTHLSLAVRGRNVLITGDAKSGKSWITGLLAEQLILQRYCVFVIDPEGDYRSLEALPGVLVFGGGGNTPSRTDVYRVLRHHDVSIVVDLSSLKHQEKHEYIVSLLHQVAAHRRLCGLPHRVIVDEAHYFLDDPEAISKLDLQMGGFTFVTHRVSLLQPEVVAATETVIMTRETGRNEIEALFRLHGRTGTLDEWVRVLDALVPGQAAVLSEADDLCGPPCKVTVVRRITAHARHRQKYLDMPVPQRNAFLFTRQGQEIGLRARTLRELADCLFIAPEDVIDGHLQRGDFSRWIESVFGERDIGRRISELEGECRLQPKTPARDLLINLIELAYLSGEEAPPDGAGGP